MESVTGRNEVNLLRLHQQRLTANPLPTPEDVVSWFGAVQSQEYAGAKWSLAMRMREATDATIDRAFNEGAILRTHVMRPTWHFVAPEDIRWLLRLTSPRVHAFNAYMYRQVGLDDKLFAISKELILEVLTGGRFLTRDELGAALAAGGVEARGMRLAYILMRAELDALICSGPRWGKQFTYMLLDERAPRVRVPERDEALMMLTKRFFVSHGPATEKDFAWWSGLTVSDAKRGLEMAKGELTRQEFDGRDHWFAPQAADADQGEGSLFLLPSYDEFLMGLASASRSQGVDTRALVFDSMIIVGGRIAGTWRRTIEKKTVIIEVAPLAPLTAEDDRVGAAAELYGAFAEMPVALKRVSAA